MTLILDGLRMQTRNTAHDHLKEQLGFPEYYGRNLDALYDLLMELPGDTEIRMIHRQAMLENLGSYGEILYETLQQAAEEKETLTFTAE